MSNKIDLAFAKLREGKLTGAEALETIKLLKAEQDEIIRTEFNGDAETFAVYRRAELAGGVRVCQQGITQMESEIPPFAGTVAEFEAACRKVWDGNADLRAEFGNDFRGYLCFEGSAHGIRV